MLDEQALLRRLRELTTGVGDLTGWAAGQLEVVVGAAVDLLGVDCVGVLLLDESGDVRTVAVSGPAAAALEAAQERLGLGPGIDALGSDRVLAVSDLTTDPRYWQLWPELADTGVRGVLAAPVVVHGEVVGNLNAVTGQRHRWSDAERRAGAAVAGLIGQLLRNASSADREVGGPGP